MPTIGVIADTHIPDRISALHHDVMPLFSDAGVKAILHAGDVSVPNVLEQLGEVAPVYAVRGNRDILRLRSLPADRTLNIEGIRIGITHGHGKLWNYLIDRIYFKRHGYNHERIIPRLLSNFPQADVIVFGHGHIPLNRWLDGQLLFNPGSPHFPGEKDLAPSIGLLHINAEGKVKGELIELAQETV